MCGKNKNFKIAGIATVGLTVAGVATNISLYSKMKDQKKMAINMNNKIKNANIQADEFINDMEKLSKNIDYDKYMSELEYSLTDAEKQRLIDDEFSFDANSESDKVLLKKMIRAMRNSQK